MIAVTRNYRFSASHRLHSPRLSAAANAELYGKCNNPFGHGHNYVLGVTASGEIDERTGLLFPIRKLDALVQEHVLPLVSHRNLNLEMPQFASVVPTTENIATVIEGLLEDNWNAYLGNTRARLDGIHIQETERNSFELKRESIHEKT